MDLFIIGNGFDCWQGLPTTYNKYKEFFDSSDKQWLRKYNIKTYFDTRQGTLNDIDIVYGESYYFGNEFGNSNTFWSSFEEGLGKISQDNIDWLWDKDDSLNELDQTIANIKNVLYDSFKEWVQSIKIDYCSNNYNFGDKNLFINFNYTETLERRFKVNKKRICYIHGNASMPNSIIVGHGNNEFDQIDFNYALLFGGYVKLNYFADQLLKATYKNPDNGIRKIHSFFVSNNIPYDSIDRILFLGHSFGMADYKYFEFLKNKLSSKARWHIVIFDYNLETFNNVLSFASKTQLKKLSLYHNIDDCLQINGFINK